MKIAGETFKKSKNTLRHIRTRSVGISFLKKKNMSEVEVIPNVLTI